MNGQNAVFDQVLAKLSPEIREEFLISKIDLEKRFGPNDEIIYLCMHLEKFAAVIAYLSSSVLPPHEDSDAILENRRLLAENLKTALEIQKISHDNRLSATVISNITRFHLLCVITGSFILGGMFLFAIQILCHLKW